MEAVNERGAPSTKIRPRYMKPTREQRAAALAKAGKGSVTLLHVVDVSALQDTGQVWVEMPSVKQFVDEELARARTYLETVQGRLQADGGFYI